MSTKGVTMIDPLECPVAAPKLLKAKSTVVLCSNCKAWITRYPTFLGYDDMDHCERCGCTSVIMREGRPYGPKSGLWDWIVAEFREVFSHLDTWEFESVICDPPIESLDWKAIDDWFNENDFHRAPRTVE